jgi:hypothetical protein
MPCAVWGHLLDPAHLRSHRITAWRILHGRLLVGAFRFHVRSGWLSPAAACCGQACCVHDPAAAGSLETLTHAFLDCPAVAPALAWLLDLWRALTGERPPADPLVVLAAAPWVWKPPPELSALWHRLRVAYLGCTWQARCRRWAGDGALAAVIAADVIVSMQRALQGEWLRVCQDVRTLAPGVLPAELFRGRNPLMREAEFRQRWPAPSAWYATQGQRVMVRLAELCPPPGVGAVAAPAAPAQGAPAGVGAAPVVAPGGRPPRHRRRSA